MPAVRQEEFEDSVAAEDVENAMDEGEFGPLPITKLEVRTCIICVRIKFMHFNPRLFLLPF